MNRNVQLIIFDCDGVLVDSEPLACDVLQEALHTLGWSLSRDELISTFVGRSSDHALSIIRERGFNVDEQFINTIEMQERQKFQAHLTPVDGVPALLDVLRDHPKCVASSSSHDRIRLSLEVTGLIDHFRANVFSAQDVRFGKPAPDLFLHASSKMGAQPAQCAVIEDSIAGVRAGRAAGMFVIGYTGTFEEYALRGAGADEIVHEMPAVANLIRQRRIT